MGVFALKLNSSRVSLAIVAPCHVMAVVFVLSPEPLVSFVICQPNFCVGVTLETASGITIFILVVGMSFSLGTFTVNVSYMAVLTSEGLTITWARVLLYAANDSSAASRVPNSIVFMVVAVFMGNILMLHKQYSNLQPALGYYKFSAIYGGNE